MALFNLNYLLKGLHFSNRGIMGSPYEFGGGDKIQSISDGSVPRDSGGVFLEEVFSSVKTLVSTVIEMGREGNENLK